MELSRVSLLLSLLLAALLQLVKGTVLHANSLQPAVIIVLLLHVGQGLAPQCGISLDNINRDELVCQRRFDCYGLNCVSQNGFLRSFAELFNIELLPCARPSPAVHLLVLSPIDETGQAPRRVLLNRTVTSSTREVVQLYQIDTLVLGTYYFTLNISEDSSTAGIAVSCS